MRILIDATTAREGGGKTFVRKMVPALAAQGHQHEIHILLSATYQQGLIEELGSAVAAVPVALPTNAIVRGYKIQTLLPQLVRKQGFDLVFTVAELGCIHPPSPHVVMVQNLKFFAPLSIHRNIASRLRLFVRQQTRKPLVSKMLLTSDRVTFVSEHLRASVLAQLPLRKEHTEVVYHGLDPIFKHGPTSVTNTQSAATFAEPYILSVSTLSPHKNLETLLAAFAQVCRVFPKFKLVIAGAAQRRSYLASLHRLAASLEIAGKVHFVGRVPYRELPALYHGADAFVFPSLLESFGLPLLEAMASETPVVASSLPVCREICADAALYFDANSPSELATKILQVLNSHDKAADLAGAGRPRAMQFSWETSAQKLLNVFDDAANRSR